MLNEDTTTTEEDQTESFDKITIKLRSDTLKRWEDADPVLGRCELVVVLNSIETFDITKSKFKLGDGQHKFTELGFIMDYSSSINDLLNRVEALEKSNTPPVTQ